MKIIMLVGLPYSGKTTFAERMGWIGEKDTDVIPDVLYYSFDQAIHHIAAREGKDYNKDFKELFPIAEKEVKEAYKWAISQKKDIVLDMTHLTKISRHKKLINVPKEYQRDCYVFPTISEEELTQRMESRPNQKIPMHVLENMKSIYQEPTLDEGFDLIIHLADDLVISKIDGNIKMENKNELV